MQIITTMVRQGFDRQDLDAMPFAELTQWHNVLMDQLHAEAEAIKKARQRKS